MAHHKIDARVLRELVDDARNADSPHVDVGPLLGLDSPLRLGVNDLHNAVTHVAGGRGALPELSLSWDGGEVTVAHLDGGAFAKLTLAF
jgi:hypothetical protein